MLLQGVISIGQRIANSGAVGSQQTGGFAVGVRFGIVGCSNSPLLTGELVVGIVSLSGGQDHSGGIADSAGHKPPQGIVGVFVGVACFAVMH